MQKKLYFLNEEEKNRILNLHESRTRKSYLTEGNSRITNPKLAVNDWVKSRDSSFEEINKMCKDETLLKSAEWLNKKDQTIDSAVSTLFDSATNWYYNISPQQAKLTLQEIKNMGNLANYCLVNKRFKELKGYDISYLMNNAFYKNKAWEEYFYNPIKSYFDSKNVVVAPKDNKNTQTPTVKNIMADLKTKTLASKVTTPPLASGIGTTTRSVSSQIPTLFQQAGIEGTSLTQDTINKLYDKLSKKA